MPLYEYRCLDCAQQVTLRHGFSDRSPLYCPACGSGKLKRLFSPVSIIRSSQDRSQDLSWIDRDVAGRLRKKSGATLSPEFSESLDRMESS